MRWVGIAARTVLASTKDSQYSAPWESPAPSFAADPTSITANYTTTIIEEKQLAKVITTANSCFKAFAGDRSDSPDSSTYCCPSAAAAIASATKSASAATTAGNCSFEPIIVATVIGASLGFGLGCQCQPKSQLSVATCLPLPWLVRSLTLLSQS